MRPTLVRAAGVALVASGLGFLLAETLAASAWQHPPYDYVRYFISDLGSPECGLYQGRDVCSPRHGLMNAMFVLQGLLFAFGGTVLSRLLAGRARAGVLALSLAQAVGVVLVGLCHASPAADADGTALLHGAGAVLAIAGGNGAAVVTGLARRRAGQSTRQSTRESIGQSPGDRTGTAGVLLGGLGLAGAVVLFATWSLLPPGVPERVAVYPFQVWQVMAGALLVRARPPR